MPVVGFRQGVPRPVRCLEIFENDSGVLVFFRRVAPDIEVSVSEVFIVTGIVGRGGTGSNSAPRLLEPWILIGGVIDYEFSNDSQIAFMCGVEQRSKIVERAEIRIYVKIIGNVVAVVAHRGWIERQQPDRRHTEVPQKIQLLNEAGK